MFGWSVKSVPGCLVLIAPSTIGDPVAFTPGFGPHDEVLTLDEPPPALLDDAVALEDAVALAAELAAEVALELLLLPQPESAISAVSATVTTAAVRGRSRMNDPMLTSPPKIWCSLVSLPAC
jgi:hypothetical protein